MPIEITSRNIQTKLGKKSDEELIKCFIDEKDREIRNHIFSFLINRKKDETGKSKVCWDSKIKAASRGFLNKEPYMLKEHSYLTVHNKILMNLFNSIENNKIKLDRKFYSYFNGLIYKTLLNIKRNFNIRHKNVYYEGNEAHTCYRSCESLDQMIETKDDSVSKHDAIPCSYDLEKNIEQKELLNIVWKKCNKYLSGVALDILLHNDITKTMTNNDLAQQYDYSTSKISTIKRKQITPVLDIIRKEIYEETGIRSFDYN